MKQFHTVHEDSDSQDFPLAWCESPQIFPVVFCTDTLMKKSYKEEKLENIGF